jgi:DNA primase
MGAIDEIKARLDIVEIIGESVQLRKTGKTYLGFCPFHHNTRTPAFTVYPDSQSFYCFGCHAAGSVFDFVMRKEGLEFRDTLQLLAQRAGVQLKERTPEDEQHDQQRVRLLDIVALAARYFNYILLQHRRGQPARDYVDERGITPETVEVFQLGYSLPEWGHLLNYLTTRKGFAPEEVEAAGLAGRSEKGTWYDRFRGRLMFPIHNTRGEVVGFGGRSLEAQSAEQKAHNDDKQDRSTLSRTPKYLNTPQTLLFDKSHVLYGLHLARDAIRSADASIIVEGYVDVLTAHQHGFRNVVAPLGTALNTTHIGLLKRLSHNVYLALDADAAGQKATLRGVSTLQSAVDEEEADLHPVVTAGGLVRWETDITLHIIKIPPGFDPDDLIKNNPQQWRDLVASAVPVMDFYLDAHTADLDLAQPHHQRLALERLVPLVAQLEGAQQRVYIARLEQVTGIKAELILDMVHSQPRQPAAGSRRPQHSPEPPPAAGSPAPPRRRGALPDPHLVALDYRAPPLTLPEDHLMALVLRYPTVCSRVAEVIVQDLDQFPLLQEFLKADIKQLLDSTENRILWQVWVDAGSPALTCSPDGATDTLVEWAQDLDEPLRAQAEQLAMLKLPSSVEYRYMQDAEESTRRLRIRQVRAWQRYLSEKTAELEDEEEQQRTVARLVELSRYLGYLSKPPIRKSYTLDLRHTLEGE